MPERAQRLHAIADGQIADLTGLISTLDEAVLRLPCPGRDKLGDGTVGVAVRHTADNYQRIAGFIQTSRRTSGTREPRAGGHLTPPQPVRGSGEAWLRHLERFEHEQFDLHVGADMLIGDEREHLAAR